MGDTKTNRDQREDDDTSDDSDDEDDADTSATGDENDDTDDEEDDDAEEGEEEEKAFLAKLDADALKFYNRRKTQLTKAREDAGRQRRKLRRLTSSSTKTAPPKPTPPKTKPTGGPVPSKEELLAELRQEMETKAQTDRVVSLAERKLETMLALPSDPDARERKLSRVLRMVDLDGCITSADVADAIADLKDDSPELFRRTRKAKPKTGGVSGPATSRVKGGSKAPDKIAGLFDD